MKKINLKGDHYIATISLVAGLGQDGTGGQSGGAETVSR